jgi:hypothetical protein
MPGDPPGRGRPVDAGGQHGEFVTPQPNHKIMRRYDVSQALCHLDQKPIPGRVPERVIDVAEPVDVEQQQG